MTDDFIQKLMIAKQVMDKSNQIPRGGASGVLPQNMSENYSERVTSAPELSSFEPIQASYNIPQEYMETSQPKNLKAPVVTEDRIKNSKLPDAIKNLMLTHPIAQPNSISNTNISDEIIEKASRLMNKGNGTTLKETSPQRQTQVQNVPDNKEFRKMLKEVVEEVLSENGLLTESETKSNETFQFRVGKHLFEGKVTKVKKIS
jgi:hypothetical protein